MKKQLPESVKIVPMKRRGATRVGEHEYGRSQREGEGSKSKDENEKIEAPKLLDGDCGMKRMS